MPQFGRFVDTRDGHVYRTVLMPDGKWWSVENLAWNGGNRIAPNNDVAHVPSFGWLYLHEQSFSYAPPNTHVVSPKEWHTLWQILGGPSFSDLVSTSVAGGNDTYGLGIIMAGIGFNNVAQNFYSYCALPYNPSILKYVYFSAETQMSGAGGSSSGIHASVRFIVDSGNIPDGPNLFGAPFQGFERGYSLEISRKISEIPTLGFAPILLPYAPADKDEWIVDAELWVTAAQAAEIQARVPPKGSPLERAISVPPRSGANTFAGLAPADAGGSVDTYLDPVVLSLKSLGQKAVAVDLYGFRIRFSLSCSSISNPYSSNPATPPTATPPAWLNQKFRAHQIEDCSTEERVIASTGKWSASPNPIKAGRGLPLSITLDYLTQERADELVAFFRGIRGNAFTAPLDFPGATSTTFVARKLSLTRPGLHWEGALEVYQA